MKKKAIKKVIVPTKPKEFTLVNRIVNFREYLDLLSKHKIPLMVVVTDKENNYLNNYFKQLFIKFNTDSNYLLDPSYTYFIINSDTINQLITSKKIKLKKIMFDNTTYEIKSMLSTHWNYFDGGIEILKDYQVVFIPYNEDNHNDIENHHTLSSNLVKKYYRYKDII